mmetsp:Transcript_25010/g.24469  ORF Transcript_25010/g.24469 Transcript_25010/m.24469 type:complete len:128 (+) Transcript_25010:174-557(+)
MGLKVNLYTYGQPRVGDINFVSFFNHYIEGVNLRAVFRNDPVPTLPFEKTLNFYHGAREVHFYNCDPNSYIAYPNFQDDTPFIKLGQFNDHYGYFCLHYNDPSVVIPADPPISPLEDFVGTKVDTDS